MFGTGQEAPRMSVRGWKALPNVRGALPKIWEWSETLLDVQEWSGGSPECPRVFGRHSRMTESGREALQDVREWSGGPPGCPGVVGGPPECLGVVGRPSRMSESGREALPHLREWSGGPPECPEVVGRHF